MSQGYKDSRISRAGQVGNMLTLESHALSGYQAALCGFETAESLHKAERVNFNVEIVNLTAHLWYISGT